MTCFSPPRSLSREIWTCLSSYLIRHSVHSIKRDTRLCGPQLQHKEPHCFYNCWSSSLKQSDITGKDIKTIYNSKENINSTYKKFFQLAIISLLLTTLFSTTPSVTHKCLHFLRRPLQNKTMARTTGLRCGKRPHQTSSPYSTPRASSSLFCWNFHFLFNLLVTLTLLMTITFLHYDCHYMYAHFHEKLIW